MNPALVRKSAVTLCSGVRAVANRVPRSSCESVSKTSTGLSSCYNTVCSFRSYLWCLVEARRKIAVEVRSFSTMSGRNNKGNRKGNRNQGRGKSNSASPDTAKTDPGKSKAINVETSSATSGSKLPKEQSEMEVALAEKSTESKTVSEMNPTKTDNMPESPAMGGALSFEKEPKVEKTETIDKESPLEPTAQEEEIGKPDVKGEDNVALTSYVSESSVKEDTKEDKNKAYDEAPKQSPIKAVDLEAKQLSDKTEDDMLVKNQPDLANNESKQVRDNKGAAEVDGCHSVTVISDSSDSNNSSPTKVDSTSVSSEAKTTHKQGGFAKETKRQDNRTYHGTRQSAVMQEREKFLAMTREEKRRFYAKKDFVKLDGIDTWKEFYCKHAKGLKKIYPDADEIKTLFRGNSSKFDADDKINAKISVYEGDITTIEIDGIVNAANSSLLGGGGVDGAIHRAAGSQLVEECRTLAGCRTGDAKTTCGYKLPAKYVIHTVGPQGTHPQDLRSCYTRCLDEMMKHNMRSIAFCCISTGIYGYPNDMAVHVALTVVRDWLDGLKQKNQLDLVDRIIFCLFLQVDIRLYHSWMQVYFPMPGQNDADKSVPEETKDKKVSSDANCPTKEGKEEDKLKSSACGEELAKMQVEEVVASEEDMDVDDGTASSTRVGRTESPDKKCKLDPDATSSPNIKMDLC